MPDVAMPRLSDSMEEATIVRWLKSDGDQVTHGEELVEIETDKAIMVYESEAEGSLEIIAAEGETVALGAPIARIGAEVSPSDSVVATPSQPAVSQASVPEPALHSPTSVVAPTGPSPARVPASPVARRLAAVLGIDLANLIGSGPRGRVVKRDIEAVADGVPGDTTGPEPGAGSQNGLGSMYVELTRTQQVIAQRMTESKATVPEFTLTTDVDMEATVAVRGELRAHHPDGQAPSYNHFVIKSCGLALRKHPLANASFKDQRFELHDHVNVGFAVAGEGVLVVPVVTDADVKGLGTIASETRAGASKVRAGTITPADLAGGTFTVSNLGMYGVGSFTAVINAPQAAILAVGALEQRVVVVDGLPAVRHRMTMTVTCDHRILYGADAARFLGDVRAALEAPISMLL